jgi:hypothetical protein
MVSDILTAISDDKSLLLFNTIALSSCNTDILITKLGLTRRQYYSRMSDLTNAGLITRSNGKYSLTSFGKVVCEAQLLIEKAKQNFWKLRAIDSVCSSAHGLSPEERSKIIETLIVENDLKEILLDRNQTNPVEKNINQQLTALHKLQALKP